MLYYLAKEDMKMPFASFRKNNTEEFNMKKHHQHHHENTRLVVNRLSRAIGHLEAVKEMVKDGRECSNILIQIAAVKSAVNNIGKIILQDHINNCVIDAVETDDKRVLVDLHGAIEKFLK